MLPFPNRPSLVTFKPNVKQTCYKAGQSRLITEETQFEAIFIQTYSLGAIILTVQEFDPQKLDKNAKYSTESRTFASIEYFSSGFYLGNSWLTKERQFCVPTTGYSSSIYTPGEAFAPVVLARVLDNGFIPCIELVNIQPDPNKPNDPIKTVSFNWVTWNIKPMDSVKIYVEAP